MRRERCGIVLMFLLAGCSEENVVPDEPIRLVVDAAIEGDLRIATEHAAESWNLEFGTRISVGSDEGDDQEVSVEFWEGECIVDGANKMFSGLNSPHLRSPHIFMCPEYTRDEPRYFFEVMRHEIGHVLGLEHVSSLFSVMKGEQDAALSFPPAFRLFTPADRQEFDRANPSFAESIDCSVVRLAVENGWPATFPELDGAPYVVWAEQAAIAFAPIDPATRSSHRTLRRSRSPAPPRRWSRTRDRAAFS